MEKTVKGLPTFPSSSSAFPLTHLLYWFSYCSLSTSNYFLPQSFHTCSGLPKALFPRLIIQLILYSNVIVLKRSILNSKTVISGPRYFWSLSWFIFFIRFTTINNYVMYYLFANSFLPKNALEQGCCFAHLDANQRVVIVLSASFTDLSDSHLWAC